VKLTGVASYDPEGDNRVEHPELVGDATDGNATTYWKTETYQDLARTKSGVGLVLDAGRRVRLSQIRVQSDTPGFTAQIKAGAGPSGPFRLVSSSEVVGASTVFRVDARARYWLLWITNLRGSARVDEVTGRG
jgi:hypothetical protein